jgi:hypothetical protein
MKQTLSSNLTLALKFLLPSCLIAGWLLSICNLYIAYWGHDSFLRLLAPLILVVFVFYGWRFVRLKKVAIHGECLYVSNYLKGQRISFADINKVVEQGWNGATYPIEISLKGPSEFGTSIQFMPKVRFGHSVQDSRSVIDELRKLAGES